jgi:hypothetical protein
LSFTLDLSFKVSFKVKKKSELARGLVKIVPNELNVPWDFEAANHKK